MTDEQFARVIRRLRGKILTLAMDAENRSHDDADAQEHAAFQRVAAYLRSTVLDLERAEFEVRTAGIDDGSDHESCGFPIGGASERWRTRCVLAKGHPGDVHVRADGRLCRCSADGKPLQSGEVLEALDALVARLTKDEVEA